MPTELKDRVFVIVGATGGIGQAVCRRLQAAGARMVVGSRRAEATAVLATEVGAHGLPVDARDSAQVDAAFEAAVQRFGRVDGAVNLAGSLLLKPAHLTSDEEWDATLATNLTSAFHVLRAAGRRLREGGSIVLVSSAAATIGLANHEAIAAAKAGVEALARAAAASYGSRGLRVNCVAPGLTRTPLTSRITENAAALKSSLSMHVLGRVVEADEVAAAIEFLLADGAVTGAVIPVDGGLASVRGRPAG